VSERYRQAFALAAGLVMGAALVLLPITSLPALSKLIGGPLVAPPSAVLIGLMTLTWLPVFLFRGGLVPRESAPVWAFFYIALISAGLAFFRLYPSYKGFTIMGTETDALITMAMAAGFYLIFSLYYRDRPGLTSFIRALNLSGIFLLAWSLVQLYVIVTSHGDYRGWMVHFHSLLSLRSLTSHAFYDRVTGFAYEPSWLGNMLNLLFLPFWLASTVTGFSAFPKVWRISLENLLLPIGALILVFSFSRIGLAAFLLTLTYLAFSLLFRLGRWVARLAGKRFGWGRGPVLNLVLALLISLAVVFVVFRVTFGMVRVMSAYDTRVARLMDLDNYYTRDPYQLARNLAFGERIIYWSVGWRVFSDFPLLGVGPGNTGLFFVEKMPLQGWQLSEIIQVADLLHDLPSVKSLWARLLSETGLLGFSAITAWLFVLWRACGFLRVQTHGMLRTVGWMGSFVIVAMVLEGFSVDSFGLPYLWVSLGVVTAASALARRELATSAEGPEQWP
jgi:O-antigen ligase/polysaccharide polymerase Wzy-like membrane protein